MASTPWKEHLKRLPFSKTEQGDIIYALFCQWRGGKELIQDFFDSAVEMGGEKALTRALQNIIQGAGPRDVELSKRVKIYTLHVQDEELVLKGRWFNMTLATFSSWVNQGRLAIPFKGGQPVEDADFIGKFKELVDGESYVLDDGSGLPSGVKTLENFNNSEMKANEEELGASMVRELKANGIAEDPVIRDDLRLHCRGSLEEQEFDAVILDGEHRAFVGSAKHVAHGTSEVEALIRSLRILSERANDTQRYSSYVPFHGRSFGACIRIDLIKEAHQEQVKHMCFRKGVGLFQRSGGALAIMQRLPFGYSQSLDPGIINVMVRGFKRLVH